MHTPSKSSFRLLLLAFFVLLQGGRLVQAQQLLMPEVRIEGSHLPSHIEPNMQLLTEQIEQLIIGYAPPIDLSHIPLHPIRTVVVLYLTATDGFRYVGNLELMLTRPIYGRTDESPILMVQEQGIEFEFTSTTTAPSIGRTLPEAPLLRRIYYYITLGAMYYYDSFSPLGGTPFFRHLQQERSYLEAAWYSSSTTISHSSYLAPKVHLTELEGKEGIPFRELWYLYHRKGLDAEQRQAYLQALHIFLQELEKLHQRQPNLHFTTLFIQTKEMEIRQLIASGSDSEKEETVQLLQKLFPQFHR